LSTQDKNRHWPGNIGYTRYKQTRAWQHWVHKIQTDTGLPTLGTQDKHEAKNITQKTENKCRYDTVSL
jgi:hypothetical protein